MADPGLTGVLLVGGASRRFRSPKPLARIGGETLAERAHAVLADACAHVLVVGKARDALPLPFPVLDDGSEVRAAIVGVAAGLRLAPTELCVVLPTDTPRVTAPLVSALAAGATGVDAAVPQTGPLPGAYRRSLLPVLERAIATGELSLRAVLADAATRVVRCDPAALANVNEPADLEALALG